MAEELERPPLKDIYRKLIADNETNEVFKKYSYNSFRDRMLNNPDASSEVADFLIDRGIIRDKEDWQQNWLAPSVVKQAPTPTKSAPVQAPPLLQPAQPSGQPSLTAVTGQQEVTQKPIKSAPVQVPTLLQPAQPSGQPSLTAITGQQAVTPMAQGPVSLAPNQSQTLTDVTTEQVATPTDQGFSQQETQRARNETRSTWDKTKDFFSSIGASADNMLTKIKAGETLLGAAQRRLLTFGDRGKQAAEQEIRVRKDITNYLKKIDQEYADAEWKRNINGSVLDVIEKGELNRLPEAVGKTVGDAAMQIFPTMLTGGYSMYAQTLPDAYKAGVEEVAKKTDRTPEEVIEAGDDAMIVANISAGIQAALEKVSGGIFSKSIASKGGYRAVRDWVIKKTGNKTWSRAAGGVLATGLQAQKEGIIEVTQELTGIAGEQLGASTSAENFAKNLSETLQTPEADRRLNEAYIGGIVGGGGLIVGGKAYQVAANPELYTPAIISKATQLGPANVIDIVDRIKKGEKPTFDEVLPVELWAQIWESEAGPNEELTKSKEVLNAYIESERNGLVDLTRTQQGPETTGEPIIDNTDPTDNAPQFRPQVDESGDEPEELTLEEKKADIERRRQEEFDSVNILKGGYIPIEGYEAFAKRVNEKYDNELAALQSNETTEIEPDGPSLLGETTDPPKPVKGRKQIEKTLSDLTETQDPLSRLNLIHNFNRTVGLAPDAATEEESSLIQKEKEKLEAEGYEVIDLTGQKFDPGLRVLVEQSIPDENLEEGQEIISRVVAPQINKDGKMVQPARVVVTVGTKPIEQSNETTEIEPDGPSLLGETTEATGQTGGGLGTDVQAVDEGGPDQEVLMEESPTTLDPKTIQVNGIVRGNEHIFGEDGVGDVRDKLPQDNNGTLVLTGKDGNKYVVSYSRVGIDGDNIFETGGSTPRPGQINVSVKISDNATDQEIAAATAQAEGGLKAILPTIKGGVVNPTAIKDVLSNEKIQLTPAAISQQPNETPLNPAPIPVAADETGGTTADVGTEPVLAEEVAVAPAEEEVVVTPTTKPKVVDKAVVKGLLIEANDEYDKAKAAFDKKKGELNKTTREDTPDLFGKRKVEEGPQSLFEIPRISPQQRDKAIQPFRDRLDKAKKEINRLSKLLNEGQEITQKLKFESNEQVQTTGTEVREGKGATKDESVVRKKTPPVRNAGRTPDAIAARNIQFLSDPYYSSLQYVMDMTYHPDLLQSIFGGPDKNAKSGRKSIEGERKPRIQFLDKKSNIKTADRLGELLAEKYAEDNGISVKEAEEKHNFTDIAESIILNHSSRNQMVKAVLDQNDLVEDQHKFQYDPEGIYGEDFNEDAAKDVDNALDNIPDSYWEGMDLTDDQYNELFAPEGTVSPFTAFDPPSESMSREQGRKARAALKEKVGKSEFARMENIHKNSEKILRGLEKNGTLKIECP